MVNLEDAVGELVEQNATRQKRSTSSYVALLIEADLRTTGLLPPAALSTDDRLARIQATLASDPAVAPALDRFLARVTRRRRSPASVAA